MTSRTAAPRGPAHTPSAAAARRLLAVAGAATLGVLAWTAPAAAHSELIGSTPEHGEEIDRAPAEVVLEFNEDIQDIGAEMVVTSPDGQEASTGAAQVEGPNVSQGLSEERPGGDYQVQWRVVSADGHPVSGEFTFSASDDVGAESAETTPAGDDGEATGAGAAENETAGEAEATEADDEVGTPEESLEQDEGGFPWGIAFAVVAVGALIALIVRARQQMPGQDTDRDEDDQPDHEDRED